MSIKTKNQIFIDRLGRIDAQQIAHQIYHQIQNSSSPGDNCSPKNSHDYPDTLMIFDTVCELLNHISARNFSKKTPNSLYLIYWTTFVRPEILQCQKGLQHLSDFVQTAFIKTQCSCIKWWPQCAVCAV